MAGSTVCGIAFALTGDRGWSLAMWVILAVTSLDLWFSVKMLRG
jgi:hypothetical protein